MSSRAVNDCVVLCCAACVHHKIYRSKNNKNDLSNSNNIHIGISSRRSSSISKN